MQYDWDRTIETNDLSHLGCTEENYFSMLDELAELLGTKRNVKLECMKLKNLALKLSDYALMLDSNTKHEYTLASMEHKPKIEDEVHSITPYITKAYGFINKREISVKEYTELYISLRDGRINI